jgi:hypothetical protein
MGKSMRDRWAAYDPRFTQIETSIQYQEREDEFDWSGDEDNEEDQDENPVDLYARSDEEDQEEEEEDENDDLESDEAVASRRRRKRLPNASTNNSQRFLRPARLPEFKQEDLGSSVDILNRTQSASVVLDQVPPNFMHIPPGRISFGNGRTLNDDQYSDMVKRKRSALDATVSTSGVIEGAATWSPQKKKFLASRLLPSVLPAGFGKK